VLRVRLTEAESAALSAAAEDADATVPELVRVALAAYLEGDLAHPLSRAIEARARELLDETVGPGLIDLAQRMAELNRSVVDLARRFARRIG